MHRTVVATALAAGMLLAGCGGGPSDKQQATKVAVAYERAIFLYDYETEWKLVAKGLQHGYKTAQEYAEGEQAHNRELNFTPEPWPADLKLTVETVAKEPSRTGTYYRIRILATAKGKSDRVTDVVVGKYDGNWLAAGAPVEPGHFVDVEAAK